MGARVYIPGLGRFLSVDPSQGGTANNYVYVSDPVNDFDLDGNFGWKSFANITSVGSIIPGPIGMASAAVSAAAYAKAGDKKNACLMAAGIAAAAIGAGMAVKAAQAAKMAEEGSTVARATRAVTRIATSVSRAATKERWIGTKVRVSPLGNFGAKHADGTANWAARLPHVHVSQAPKPNNPAARTSIGWHRPWQTTF